MALVTVDAKHRVKRSTIPGVSPSIGPSDNHTDGTWGDNDVYVSEFFFNIPDSRLWLGVQEISFGPSNNLSNADLVQTSNRVYDLDGFTLDFFNGSQYKIDMSYAPPVGESSVLFTAYGTTSMDVSHEFKTGSGTAMRIMGDKSINMYESLNISTPAGASYGLNIIADADYSFQIINTGLSGFGIAASFGSNSPFRAVSVENTHATGNGLEGTANYVGVFGHGGTYGVAGEGVTGVLGYSNLGGGYGGMFLQSAGIGALKTDGKINTVNLPLSSTGLSTGDLYADTAANILANGDLVIGIKQ